MPSTRALVANLIEASRNLGAVEAETDPRDHMPDGGAYLRAVQAEHALALHIRELEAECATLRIELATARAPR